MKKKALLFVLVAGAVVQMASGQAPGRGPARGGTAAAPQATLAQLMRGILFPSSNVVFAAQSQNPAEVKPAKDPSLATNPLESTYGGWTAVENSGLAIAEAASLLTVPGRKCSNGLDVPLRNPDWAKFVQQLRDAGLATYKAAQSKNQDKILEAADVLTTACGDCHEKYREKPTLAERCK